MSDYQISRRAALAALGAVGAAITLGWPESGNAASSVMPHVYGKGGPPWETGAALCDGVSLTIADLLARIPAANALVFVVAYGSYTNGHGGGLFCYRADMPKANHDGGRYMSATVPWNGTAVTHAAFLTGVGESDLAGFGCWERMLTEGVSHPEHFGAVSNDDTFGNAYILNHALRRTDLFLRPAAVYAVEDTVRTGFRWRQLCGMSSVVRSQRGSVLKWIGPESPRKAVVLLGANEVGAEPAVDSSGIVCKQFEIAANGPNGRAGFGLYGTYLTNETECDRITVEGASQHNFYFARGWYAKLTNLTALNGLGCGVSLGMPLRYSDGTVVTWTTAAPLELNNMDVRNIRSNYSGKQFSDVPGSFSPDNAHHLRWGYGIGAGVGNGFRLDSFLAENSGGVNLYCYTRSEPSKSISHGYLENSCKNAGLDPATSMINILLEHTSSTGGLYTISDVFCNYHSGGVLHIGEKRMVKLARIHQPRFLKSRTELFAPAMRKFLLTEDVYYELSTHNVLFTDPVIASGRVNTSQPWQLATDLIPPAPGYRFSIWVKGEGQPLSGALLVTYDDGTTQTLAWPSSTADWVLVGDGSKSLRHISRTGAAGTTDAFAQLSILHHPRTDR